MDDNQIGRFPDEHLVWGEKDLRSLAEKFLGPAPPKEQLLDLLRDFGKVEALAASLRERVLCLSEQYEGLLRNLEREKSAALEKADSANTRAQRLVELDSEHTNRR